MRGTLKLYDIFPNGQVREKDAKTGQMDFVDAEYAIAKIDSQIEFYTKCAEKYKGAGMYYKVFNAKIEIFKQMRDFVAAHK